MFKIISKKLYNVLVETNQKQAKDIEFLQKEVDRLSEDKFKLLKLLNQK